MKKPSKPKSSARRKSRKPKRNQSGIAIITVLSVLMLMSVLMLAFFAGARSELESSRLYASSLRTRQLTDIVTNLVVAQIRQATTLETRGGIRSTWVSQPGLITTFTNRRATRYEQLVAAKYKLFSSAKMVADRNETLTDGIPSDWNTNPQRWVDLNDPVYSKLDSRLYFPIVDPRAYRGDEREDSIEGFTYSERTSGGSSITGTVPPSSNEDDQRVPMPVEWLYILDDGTIGYLDSGDRFVPTSSDNRPSKRNPITARVAFWTDDESSKININTAAEGVPWDIPRYDSDQEHDYSKYQPTRDEYYRYPGHPAMVSLSSVFYPHKDTEGDKKIMEDLLQVAPKHAWEGSSEGGTKKGTGVKLDLHRLYATEDELLYRHGTRGSQAVSNDSPRKENEVFKQGGRGSSRAILERARFFLTANSNAPELTLFGTPRMSMWPLPANGNYTVYDRLFAKCNQIGGARYFWQRQQANSRHNEVYGVAGSANIELLTDYLTPLTEKALPGYGRSLGQKYDGSGTESDTFQILASCWDTIRTTNLYDPMPGATRYSSTQGQIASGCLCGGPSTGGNHASNAHQTRWDRNVGFPAKGYGRLFSLSEICLVFIRHQAGGAAGGGGGGGGEQASTVEVGVALEVFCPSHGFTKIRPSSFMTVNGAPRGSYREQPSDPQMTIFGQTATLGALQGGRNGTATRVNQRSTSRWWGAHGGPGLFTNSAVQFWVENTKDIPVPPGASSITVNMQDVWRVIMFDDPAVNIGNLIQIAYIEWPDTITVPMPSVSTTTWDQRRSSGRLVEAGDVTRSMVVSHGDYRHVSAKRITEAGIFRPHPDFDGGQKHAHCLTDMNGDKFPGFSIERDMISDANYSENLVPDFPYDPGSTSDFAPLATGRGASFSMDPEVTGDWDTGYGAHLDGPYINRIDDGSSEGNDPYFDINSLSRTSNVMTSTFFSPNRLIAGPGQFGSMSTGVRTNVPWRTLLFRPDPKHYGAPDQPARGDLPDHLFMDLFWMPVVEPYAVTMPFATRGKINLNYQIIPFDNIKRATALHALMKAERVLAIPKGKGSTYKTNGQDEWRHKIDAYETLKQAEHRFKDGEVFRSPTEICELYLVPKDEVGSIGNPDSRGDYRSMRNFWEKHNLTGDNVKERPYTNMQPRLTTKSNVFKVHMMVQTLKKVPRTDIDKFDSEKDRVTGQWRGSAVVERFIDPEDNRIPNYIQGADPTTKTSLDEFYSYRILDVKQFAP